MIMMGKPSEYRGFRDHDHGLGATRRRPRLSVLTLSARFARYGRRYRQDRRGKVKIGAGLPSRRSLRVPSLAQHQSQHAQWSGTVMSGTRPLGKASLVEWRSPWLAMASYTSTRARR